MGGCLGGGDPAVGRVPIGGGLVDPLDDERRLRTGADRGGVDAAFAFGRYSAASIAGCPGRGRPCSVSGWGSEALRAYSAG